MASTHPLLLKILLQSFLELVSNFWIHILHDLMNTINFQFFFFFFNFNFLLFFFFIFTFFLTRSDIRRFSLLKTLLSFSFLVRPFSFSFSLLNRRSIFFSCSKAFFSPVSFSVASVIFPFFV